MGVEAVDVIQNARLLARLSRSAIYGGGFLRPQIDDPRHGHVLVFRAPDRVIPVLTGARRADKFMRLTTCRLAGDGRRFADRDLTLLRTPTDTDPVKGNVRLDSRRLGAEAKPGEVAIP